MTTPAPNIQPGPAAYLAEATRAIDAEFGEGYARDNPALVAALVQSATIDAAISTGRVAHDDALGLARQITAEVCETILKLKPRFFG